jgi:hypothetical protein
VLFEAFAERSGRGLLRDARPGAFSLHKTAARGAYIGNNRYFCAGFNLPPVARCKDRQRDARLMTIGSVYL